MKVLYDYTSKRFSFETKEEALNIFTKFLDEYDENSVGKELDNSLIVYMAHICIANRNISNQTQS